MNAHAYPDFAGTNIIIALSCVKLPNLIIPNQILVVHASEALGKVDIQACRNSEASREETWRVDGLWDLGALSTGLRIPVRLI